MKGTQQRSVSMAVLNSSVVMLLQHAWSADRYNHTLFTPSIWMTQIEDVKKEQSSLLARLLQLS